MLAGQPLLVGHKIAMTERSGANLTLPPQRPVRLLLDHVTIAGAELASLEAAFAGQGLTTVYGGPHSTGLTHMAGQ